VFSQDPIAALRAVADSHRRALGGDFLKPELVIVRITPAIVALWRVMCARLSFALQIVALKRLRC
jgi:hypothetical protein